MTSGSETDLVLYEKPAPGVARIVLNRPKTANAQNTNLFYDLNDAFDRAAADNEVNQIIAANGKHFSSGHDVLERDHHDQERRRPVTPFPATSPPRRRRTDVARRRTIHRLL